MGMPISLALRGRHTDDHTAGLAWAQSILHLREADRMFSTYRRDSSVNRLNRGEMTLQECPAEINEVLALGEAARRESGGAFNIRRSGPDGQDGSAPAEW